MPNSELVQSLLRGADLLKLISSSPEGLRLSELCAATGLKKSTAHNLMRTLCFRKFAVKDEHNRFHIGPAVQEIADGTPAHRKLRHARSAIQKLRTTFPDCTITLSALVGAEVRCLFRVTPFKPGVVQLPGGRCFLPFVSASAILLQSLYPQKTAALEQQYPFEEYGAGLWGSIENFSAAKEKVVQDGFCCRFSRDMVLAAFPLPEYHVLGFHFPAGTEPDLNKFKNAVAEFCCAVWENSEVDG